MLKNEKVKVIPCSGMGKVYGLMAREATLHAVRHLCPQHAETMCLAYVVTGDNEIKESMKDSTFITIDGCPLMCSAKSVAAMGGDIQGEFKVLDVMKEHRGVRPGTATELTPEGWKVVEEIGGIISGRVQQIREERR